MVSAFLIPLFEWCKWMAYARWLPLSCPLLPCQACLQGAREEAEQLQLGSQQLTAPQFQPQAVISCV